MSLTLLKFSFKKHICWALSYCKYKYYDDNIVRQQFLTKLNYASVSKQDDSLKGRRRVTQF